MRADLILAGLLAAVFGLALWAGASYRWEAGLGPLLAGGAGLALMVVLIPVMLRGGAVQAKLTGADARQLLWFFAAIALVSVLGFALGGFLYVFTFVASRRRDRRGLLTALLAALPVPAAVVLLFDWTLGIELWPGLFGT